MARRCALTGKRMQTGNNVSHSKRRTRRTFLLNIQNLSLWSNALERRVKLRIPASTLRSIETNGGLDNFLMKTSSNKLTDEAISIKKKIKKALASAA